MSQVSYGTITIVDTNDIESITIEYARNQSTSNPPDKDSGGWDTTRPNWEEGYYIWQRARIHKSGTDSSADTFGVAVCLTGSTGQIGETGPAGQGLIATKTQYTNVANNITITINNHTSYTWTDDIPEYNVDKPVYWGRITNTYSNPAKTEYLIYKDNGITKAVAESIEANKNSLEALSIARATEQHYWFNPKTEGTLEAGAYITDTPIDTFKNGKVGGYLLTRSDGLELGKGTNKFMTLSGSELDFYRPGTTIIDAKFTVDGATIGRADGTESYMALDYHSLKLTDKEGNQYLFISDLRDKNGEATISEEIIVPKNTKQVFTSLSVHNVISAFNKETGEDITNMCDVQQQDHRFIYLGFTPETDFTLLLEYKTVDKNAKAYTLGYRSPDSTIGALSFSSGYNTTASGSYSHAEGSSTTASGLNSHAEGTGTTASGLVSHAEGSNSKAIEFSSHAEGINTTASGGSSHAEGYGTTASGTDSHAEGFNTTASGGSSHAEGSKTIASKPNSHAEGSNTTASEMNSHAEGSNTTASSYASHAEGFTTTASGGHSHAEGDKTIASGPDSHAEGYNTKAIGLYSHAEGNGTTASGYSSHAEGFTTTAEQSSHAEGHNTTATGYYSHAEGDGATASGLHSHAEGTGTTASGTDSHAEGYKTKAIGDYSHSQNFYTIASHKSQTAIGEYNIEDTGSTSVGVRGNYAVIVGNGTSEEARSNALTVDWNGNVNASGSVNVGGTNILELVYPVGSIYMSVNSTDPGTLFGGTWTRLTDTFLLAAGSTYAADNGTHTTATGGAATVQLQEGNLPSHHHSYTAPPSATGSHTLAVAEIPAHYHQMRYNPGSTSGAGYSWGGSKYTWSSATESSSGMKGAGGGKGHTHSITGSSSSTGNTGSGTAHNNMPPYLPVYMWKRTA